jgi:hypothetical protein
MQEFLGEQWAETEHTWQDTSSARAKFKRLALAITAAVTG